jgi:uncharacterized protein YcbK (DUF882 family)
MADKRRTGSNPLDTFLSQIPDYVGDKTQKKQSKTETKTKPETNAKTETKSETQSQTKTLAKPQAETVTKTIVNTETKAKPKTEAESKTITETVTQAETFANTFANEIKVKAAGQTEAQRFEDSRKRQTYWLDPETIEMINELAKRSGTNKYHVVSAGVRLLYDYVFEPRQD